MSNSHETILFVDLEALEYNYHYLKSKLNASTEIIAVVKAFAYGHGDIRIAKKLESLGVHAFWVADFEEGIKLRESGIDSRIIIANPGSKSYSNIIDYSLQPVIYNFRLLDLYGGKGDTIDVHIKFNSGMNRYGFHLGEMEMLAKKLKEYPNLKIQSICTHLSSSNESSKDEFTRSQLLRFEEISSSFSTKTKVNPKKHILNTAGVLRFPDSQEEMVRLGIGLYGIGNDTNLKPIAKLQSHIVQILNLNRGDKVGYDATFIANKKMRIGIIPIGYADGINRKLGNENGWVIIDKKQAKIIGEISMDSMIIDLTIIDANEGDIVTIFDADNKVSDIAKNLKTIPYEILATLNRRIKRVYS
ncbi:MAG: alanine racemase [Flavobacteriales bacterium]|nr:alanine racemase [Flavobacteriales bacterium]|tara:strand:+ start:56210 stop:57286 length:1077 start_codon:yes stop_codon:yes gene_type:complete